MSENNLVLMQGNEACVRGALAAGMTVYAGYPITPSTEIAELSAELLPKQGGYFIQMEDEISSMAVIIGASAVGAKAMTATSGPGFSLMQENIGYAAMTEMPCVVVNVQRTGPSTGLATSPSQGDVMQAKWGTHGDHPIIALAPSGVEETYHLIVRAFNLSEKYCTPVIFLMDEIVGHLREGIRIPSDEEFEIINRKLPDPRNKDWKPYEGDPQTLVPTAPPFGMGWRYHVTGLVHNEKGLPTSSTEETRKLCTRLMEKIERNKDDIMQWEEIMTEDADIVLVCYGGTTRAAVKAVKDARALGIKVGMFRLITIWPFPDEAMLAMADKVDKILVVEHNYGQIVHEVERATKDKCEVAFLGCVNATTIMPSQILEKIKEVAGYEC
ncbi:MAG: 2-oxoacid:acceptor oxidoreductase subunit alpha [Lachnospiraceae bacterium]|jgi:2-oxoglutarate ferredoxin oxidoreductase subunit alpha